MRPGLSVFQGHEGVRDVRVERLLASRLARLQHVEAHASNNRGEPPAEVLDAGRALATEPEPSLLDGVVRFGERTEHPVGHGLKPNPVLLEAPWAKATVT